MAKRITFSLIVLLIASVCLFVSCSEEPAKKPDVKPTRDPVVNEAGEVGENLVYNGNFDEGTDSDLKQDGSTLTHTAGVGIDSSSALLVEQSEIYGEVVFDLTEYYGYGKSYYIEAWFKNVGGEGTRTDDLTAYLSFNIVTGAGYDATGKTYDIDGQYDGDWLSDDEALDIFGFETNCTGVSIADGQWHKVSAILDAENIQKVMEGEDAQNGGSGDPTMYLLSAVFFVGTYPNQDGYKYYLDNVIVKDLNTELEIEGKTYEGADDEGDAE